MQTSVKESVAYAAAAAGVVSMASTAMGETATGELEVEAGIDNSVTVVCEEALSFGATTFSGEAAMDAAMDVSVDENGDLATENAPELVALGTDRAQAGECTLYNSTSSNETNISVTYPDLPGTGGVALTGEGVMGLDPGDSTNELTVDLDDPSDITSQVNSNGEATFRVTGTLTIPKNAPADPGGYTTTITVEVNDNA